MIKITDLDKVFKTKTDEVHALKKLNFTLPNKGFVFICGKSGSGKSTLLNMMAGFDSPSSGTIEFNNVNITLLNERELDNYLFKEVGFIFQNYSLLENLTVKENIILGAKTKSEDIKALYDEAIPTLLEKVGLKDYEDKLCKNLSGGEKQRVSITRALIKKPKIILADEPCGNLDMNSSKLVLDILKEYSKESLVILVSHNLNEAYKYADRIITLNKGNIKSDVKFNPDKKIDKDIKYIDDITSLNNEDLDQINKEIENKEISGFLLRKHLFEEITTQEEFNPEFQTTGKKSSLLFKTLFKLISKKKVKSVVFMFLTSICLSLFSVFLSFLNFDSSSMIMDEMPYENAISLSYIKGASSNGQTYPYQFRNLNNKDKNKVINSGYDGKYAEIGAYTFTGPYINRGVQLNFTHFKTPFLPDSTGNIIADVDFIKENLNVGELIIDPVLPQKLETSDPEKAPSDDLKNLTYEKYGVYITDYMADSILVNRGICADKITSENGIPLFEDSCYDLLLGEITSPSYGNRAHGYINGIIRTNYKEQLLPLFASFGSSIDENKDLLAKPENALAYNYILNSLGVTYSTEKNFVKEFNNWTDNNIVSNVIIKSSLDSSSKVFIHLGGLQFSARRVAENEKNTEEKQRYLELEKLLTVNPKDIVNYYNGRPLEHNKVNGMLIKYDTIDDLFPNMTSDQIQMLFFPREFRQNEDFLRLFDLNDIEIPPFLGDFNSLYGTFETIYTLNDDEIFVDKDRSTQMILLDKFIEDHSNVFTFKYNEKDTPLYSQTFNSANSIANEDLFKKGIKNSYKNYSFLFLDAGQQGKLNKAFEGSTIYFNSPISVYLIRINEMINDLNSLFYLFSFLMAFVSILIVTFYCFIVVRDNKYNIGVLKSLGYRGRELTIVFGVFLLSFALITTLFYLLGYFLIAKLTNVILLATFEKNLNSAIVINGLTISQFNYVIYLPVAFILISFVLFFALLYLFILRRIKAQKILQNKD